MGILIPNYKKPENCFECPCYDNDIRRCAVMNRFLNRAMDVNAKEEINPLCTLIEVPDEHGPLVDSDELTKHIQTILEEVKHMFKPGVTDAVEALLLSAIVDQEPVIEATPKKDEKIKEEGL